MPSPSWPTSFLPAAVILVASTAILVTMNGTSPWGQRLTGRSTLRMHSNHMRFPPSAHLAHVLPHDLPQQNALPKVSRAQLAAKWVLTATNSWPPPTSAGSLVSSSCPFAGDFPQHHALPDASKAQVWPPPAAMVANTWPPETRTGCVWLELAPLPSWPELPSCLEDAEVGITQCRNLYGSFASSGQSVCVK